MKRIKMFAALALMLSVLAFASGPGAFAGQKQPGQPSEKDKCAVCGMFVAKYTDWVSQIVFRDGSRAFFDGPKDMLKYYLDMKRYGSSKSVADVDSIYVKDYYSLSFIDARSAWFVLGSDISGPMGRELAPFEKETAAKEFMKDHKGRRILRMKEITPGVMKGLDE